jgi:peptidoglycan/LPS O-acetylase OafA/YrhL
MDALDGVRGLAILLVLLVHFVGDDAAHGMIERGVTKLASYGAWGVDLFFVLSGFLITGILCDSKTKPDYFRSFYVRRILRISPLYYGVLVLLFVVLPVLPIAYPDGLEAARQNQMWLWLYASNIYISLHASWHALPYVSHFWSLAVEEHFYLVWPWVVLVCSRRTLLAICVACAAFSLALRSVLSFEGASDVALIALTPCRLDALCTGAFLAVTARAIGIERLGRHAMRWFVAFSALVVVISIVSAKVGSARALVLPARGTLVAFMFGALLVACVVAPRASTIGWLFRSSAMRFFGKYSYGLYVFQAFVATAFQRHGFESALTSALGSHAAAMIAQAIVGISLSLLMAIASYELFEKHFLRLKARLAPATPAALLTQSPRPI